MSVFQKYFVLFAISLGYAASYMLPYIKYVFYDQLLLAINCTNEEAGLLLTVYTIMNLILYIPGGYVADKFSAKYILVCSLFGTGVLNFVFAFSMNLSTAWIVWILLAFTTAFAFWSGILKAIRLLGSADEQGKMYGFFNSGVGIFSAVVSSIALLAYGMYEAEQVLGLKAVVMIQGAACVLSSLIVLFFYAESKDDTAEESADDKFQSKDVLVVLKNPVTWALGILIFCGHGIYTSTSYFNPYMTNVLGVALTFSGVLAIVRTHVLRTVSAPIGGIIADKLKSPALVLVFLFVLMSATLIIFTMLPQGTSVTVAIALQLGLAAITFAAYGILYSCVEEANVPRKLTGTTIAMASMIGYLPDMIYNPLFGRWLDVYQNDGYVYIFAFLAASGLVGAAMAYYIRRKGIASRMSA